MGKELIDAVEGNSANRARFLVLIRKASRQSESREMWYLDFDCAASEHFVGTPVIRVAIPKSSAEPAKRALLLSVSDERGRIAMCRMYIREEGNSDAETHALDLLLSLTLAGHPQEKPDATMGVLLIAVMLPQTPAVLGSRGVEQQITRKRVQEAIGHIGAGELLMSSAHYYTFNPMRGLQELVERALESRVVSLSQRV